MYGFFIVHRHVRFIAFIVIFVHVRQIFNFLLVVIVCGQLLRLLNFRSFNLMIQDILVQIASFLKMLLRKWKSFCYFQIFCFIKRFIQTKLVDKQLNQFQQNLTAFSIHINQQLMMPMEPIQHYFTNKQFHDCLSLQIISQQVKNEKQTFLQKDKVKIELLNLSQKILQIKNMINNEMKQFFLQTTQMCKQINQNTNESIMLIFQELALQNNKLKALLLKPQIEKLENSKICVKKDKHIQQLTDKLSKTTKQLVNYQDKYQLLQKDYNKCLQHNKRCQRQFIQLVKQMSIIREMVHQNKQSNKRNKQTQNNDKQEKWPQQRLESQNSAQLLLSSQLQTIRQVTEYDRSTMMDFGNMSAIDKTDLQEIPNQTMNFNNKIQNNWSNQPIQFKKLTQSSSMGQILHYKLKQIPSEAQTNASLFQSPCKVNKEKDQMILNFKKHLSSFVKEEHQSQDFDQTDQYSSILISQQGGNDSLLKPNIEDNICQALNVLKNYNHTNIVQTQQNKVKKYIKKLNINQSKKEDSISNKQNIQQSSKKTKSSLKSTRKIKQSIIFTAEQQNNRLKLQMHQQKKADLNGETKSEIELKINCINYNKFMNQFHKICYGPNIQNKIITQGRINECKQSYKRLKFMQEVFQDKYLFQYEGNCININISCSITDTNNSYVPHGSGILKIIKAVSQTQFYTLLIYNGLWTTGKPYGKGKISFNSNGTSNLTNSTFLNNSTNLNNSAFFNNSAFLNNSIYPSEQLLIKQYNGKFEQNGINCNGIMTFQNNKKLIISSNDNKQISTDQCTYFDENQKVLDGTWQLNTEIKHNNFINQLIRIKLSSSN